MYFIQWSLLRAVNDIIQNYTNSSYLFQDSEVMELRKTIEALRQQSVDAGLTVACLQSTSPGHHQHHHHHHSPPSPARHQHTHLSPNIASCSVLNVTSGSRSSSPEKSGLDLARRHTFTGNCKDLVVCEFTEAGETSSPFDKQAGFSSLLQGSCQLFG